MVEAKVVVGNKGSKEGRKKWTAIGAVLVVLVAIALTYKHAQNPKSCRCAQVSFLHFLLLLFFFVHFSFQFSSSEVVQCVHVSSFGYGNFEILELMRYYSIIGEKEWWLNRIILFQINVRLCDCEILNWMFVS